MRRVAAIVLLLILVGCASTLTYNPETKVLTAKDYTVKVSEDGTITAAPNRWFTTGFLNNLFRGLFDTAGKVVPLVAPIVTGK